MAKKKQTQTQSGLENIEESLTRTEQFIENNYKQFIYGLGVLAVLIAAFWLIRLQLNNKAKDALAQMFVAEEYFAKDSIKLALNGDGNYLGFVDIADEYSSTKPGNLANYYAGVCYLRIGEFENAIKYLEKFNKKDQTITPLAYGCTGDAYIELGDTEKGIDFYMKAVNFSENSFYNPIYLLKAGQVYELEGNKEKALEMYKQIEEKYPESSEGNNIQKYIARVSN